MMVDLGSGIQGMLVKEDNLEECIAFAKPEWESSWNVVKSRFGVVDVTTRSTSFKAHPGEWIIKQGPLLYKLSAKELNDLYKTGSLTKSSAKLFGKR